MLLIPKELNYWEKSKQLIFDKLVLIYENSVLCTEKR